MYTINSAVSTSVYAQCQYYLMRIPLFLAEPIPVPYLLLNYLLNFFEVEKRYCSTACTNSAVSKSARMRSAGIMSYLYCTSTGGGCCYLFLGRADTCRLFRQAEFHLSGQWRGWSGSGRTADTIKKKSGTWIHRYSMAERKWGNC